MFIMSNKLRRIRRKLYSSARLLTLIGLFHFGKYEEALAAELGMTVSIVQAWNGGKSPVPVVCVKYLELLDSNELRCAGVWNGARAEGSWLIVSAGYQVGIELEEIERLADYRRLFHLRTLRTKPIEHRSILALSSRQTVSSLL